MLRVDVYAKSSMRIGKRLEGGNEEIANTTCWLNNCGRAGNQIRQQPAHGICKLRWCLKIANSMICFLSFTMISEQPRNPIDYPCFPDNSPILQPPLQCVGYRKVSLRWWPWVSRSAAILRASISSTGRKRSFRNATMSASSASFARICLSPIVVW